MSNNRIGRKMILILRHKLDKIKHTKEGYVNIDDLIKQIYELKKNMVQNIVDSDSKNRFNLKIINNKLHIRANQGHTSGNLDDDLMLERILEPIDGCYHGTFEKNLHLIKKNGLSRMNRRHIHIAESDESISGKRKSANIKIYINMEEAMKDGIKFYKSLNGVILTPGNKEGIILPKYFLNILKI